MVGNTRAAASPKRLSPTASFLLTKAVPGYSTLMSVSCFADEIAASSEEDYEEYAVLRSLITVSTWSDGAKDGKFSCAKMWALIDAEDHRPLVRALGVLAEHDIPLNCALKECEYPDYDELSECIENEMNAFVDAAGTLLYLASFFRGGRRRNHAHGVDVANTTRRRRSRHVSRPERECRRSQAPSWRRRWCSEREGR